MSGWNQKPDTRCRHTGLLAAQLVAPLYKIGAEWACPCGEVFVVVRSDHGHVLKPHPTPPRPS